jgi:predicted NUDIX family phosphoesterase
MHRERVLCVPRRDYEQFLTFQGIETGASALLTSLLETERVAHLPRANAEGNLNFKQIVTYTLVQHEDKLLSFRRGQFSRVASFLKGARCVGFGGHVTEGDADIFGYQDQGVRTCAAREIEEELQSSFGPLNIDPSSLELLGILNDDSSEVGRKHVAIVFKYTIVNWEGWSSIREGEPGVRSLKWIEINDLRLDLNDFEYWSQLCIRKFFPKIASQQSGLRMLRSMDTAGKHLIIIVGTIGSGKSYTARILEKSLGYSLINSGEIVANLVGLPPIPLTNRSAFQNAAAELVSSEEGIHVQTPPDLAFLSYQKREAKLSVREFMELYDAPVEREIQSLARRSDAIVFNWYGEESYNELVTQLVDIIGSSKRGRVDDCRGI